MIDRALTLALSTVLLAACGDPDHVLFVTATQIGIAGDMPAQTAVIGYDRYEGVVGPVYDEGQAPPVYARLESNLSIVNPKISQLYATGDAALIAVNRMDPPAPEALKTDGKRKKRVMVFATGTNWGLQASFRQEGLSSMSLGYKRAEVSYIPLSPDTTNAQGDKYASVLAAIDLGFGLETAGTSTFSTSQFFATGDAARQIAANSEVRNLFKEAAEKSLISADYGPGAFGDRLLKEDGSDPAFRDRLVGWLKAKKIPAGPTVFMNGDIYPAEKREAVRDLIGEDAYKEVLKTSQ